MARDAARCRSAGNERVRGRRGHRRPHLRSSADRGRRDRGHGCATCGPRWSSAGAWNRTGPIRCCSSSTRSRKPDRVGPDPGRHGHDHRRQREQRVRTFVVLGSALWAMLVAGIAGPAWSVLEDRERYRMLKYLYVSPATFLVLLIGRGGAAPRRGRDGDRHRARVRRHRPRRAVRPRDRRLAAARRLPRDRAGRRSSRSACCSPRSACRPARRAGRIPEAVAGALFLVSGVVFPLAVLPAARAGRRPAEPDHVVAGGCAPRAVPRERQRRRRSRLVVAERHGNARTAPRPH